MKDYTYDGNGLTASFFLMKFTVKHHDEEFRSGITNWSVPFFLYKLMHTVGWRTSNKIWDIIIHFCIMKQ